MKPYSQTYEILSKIGQGGMGSVYLARHLRLGTLWALKEVDKRADGQVDLLAEANMLKKLSHPSLPRIVDIYEDDAHLYLVMDYIEGVPMDERLREEGKFSESMVRVWAEQLCEALRYLHERQPNPIIFRDMKPGNVRITPEGKVKVVDFGTAREFKRESASDTSALGTRGYAAPEQFGTSQTDARTDIYSLGVTLYHMVTGKSPNDPPYELLPIRQWDRSLSEGMEHIIAKCTRGNPAERYQSIAELQHDLRNIDRFSSASRRRRRINGFKLAACVLLILAGLSSTLLGYRRMETEQVEAYRVQYDQGLALIQAGKLDEAQQILFAADASQNKAQGHIALIAALLRMGEPEKCLQLIEETVSAYPSAASNAELNYCWGSALYEQGDSAGALEKFKKASAAEPENTTYALYLARTYAETGDLRQANDLFVKLKNADDQGAVSFVYAGILEAQGDAASAEAEYKRAIDTAKDDAIRLAAYRELTAVYKEQRTDDPQSVEREIMLLLAMRSAFPNQEQAFVLERLGEAYYAKGLLTNGEEDFRQSIACFEELIGSGYGRASSYTNIAIVQQRLKEYDAAEQTYLQMLNNFPNNADAYVQLAFLVAERETQKPQSQRNYAPVVQYYQQAIEYGATGANLQRLEGVIADLKAGGWIK